MIPFLDIYSGSQGPRGIDWPTLARYLLQLDPQSGVIVKVSEGTDYVNPFLHPQRWGAHAAGIQSVGLYHYGRPSRGTGHDEAGKFFSAIGDDGGIQRREFLCYDLEDPAVSPTADLDAYVLDLTQPGIRSLGIGAILYSAPYYLAPHNLSHDPRIADLGCWLAAPGATETTIPAPPEPWKSAGKQILFLQHSWQGHVPGIDVPVDLNWLIGDISRLAPYQWGMQPDPVAGKPAIGVPDVSTSSDVPTIIKHCLDILKTPSPDLATLYADLAAAETRFGLQGA